MNRENSNSRRSFLKRYSLAAATLFAPGVFGGANGHPGWNGRPATPRCQSDIPLDPKNGGKSILPALLKKGDILFSTTPHFGSRVIRDFTGGGPASHVRIVADTDITPQDPFIAEAVPGSTVRKIALSQVIKDDSFVAAFRFPGLTANDTDRLYAWLNSQVGKAGYDRWGAVKSAFFRYNGNKVAVNLGDKKGTFCSKLAIDAFAQIGKNLAQVSGNWAPNGIVELTWFDGLEYIGHLKTPV